MIQDKEIAIVDKYNKGMSINKLSKEYGLDWHRVERILTKNNVMLRQRYKINEHYFDNIDTPNKAYILGFLYADGSNTSNYEKKRYCVTITLKQSDAQILYDIKNEIGYEAPIKLREYGDGPIATFDICNKHIVLRLHELGVIPNKTLTLQFPQWLDKNLYSHFIRGYFDGDGCITYRRRKVASQLQTTIIGTDSMCSSFVDIISNTCSANAHIYSVGHEGCRDNIKTLSVYGNMQCKKFLDYIYQDADLKLERKYKRYIDWYYQNN